GGEVLLGGALVTGRVDRVEADQALEQRRRLGVLLRGRAGRLGAVRAQLAGADSGPEGSPISATSSRVSGKSHAVRTPGVGGPLSSSGGSSCEQSSWAFGQRVWNRHALGGSAGLGTSPVSRRRPPPWREGSATG